MRVCAICTQEPALPDEEEEDETKEEVRINGGKRLKLRELRTLERQKERKHRAKSSSNTEEDADKLTGDEVEGGPLGPESQILLEATKDLSLTRREHEISVEEDGSLDG